MTDRSNPPRRRAAAGQHRDAFRVFDTPIPPGARRTLEIPVARLPIGTWMTLPVIVIRGLEAGPRVFLTAVTHGDELNGIEIIRRVLEALSPRSLAGSVIAVPVVNPFAFIGGSRYLPDRRDLNRAFPGSPKGSLAARMAHLLMSEIVALCDLGIDLHTGSDGRDNLPQVRGALDDERVRSLAMSFGTLVALDARTRAGSLRGAAAERGCGVLVYEGGEAGRFSRAAVEIGTAGVLRVLGGLDMIDDPPPPPRERPIVPHRTRWIRASRGGLWHLGVALGDIVEEGTELGMSVDALGEQRRVYRAPDRALVIGVNRHGVVHRGDALVHLALVKG